MSYTKTDLEMARIHRGGMLVAKAFDLVKALIKYGAFSFIAWCLFSVLSDMLCAKPRTLEAFAQAIEKLNVPKIIHWLATIVLGGGWVMSNGRNRKLVKKYGALRHELEHNNPANERSGLDENGDAEEDQEG